MKSIGNTLGHKFNVILSPLGLLQAIELNEEQGEVFINYGSDSSLLQSIRYPNGDFRLYDYDLNGRVKSVASQTGAKMAIEAEACLDSESKCIQLIYNGELMEKIQVAPNGDVLLHSEKGKKFWPKKHLVASMHLRKSVLRGRDTKHKDKREGLLKVLLLQTFGFSALALECICVMRWREDND